jgi:CubicO group peptidase (beta-lactamase class C family)
MPFTDSRSARPASVETGRDRAAHVLREFVRSSRVPGASVAVASPDEVLFSAAVGVADLAQGRLATPDDQYPWFSMTKTVTATVAMQLHRRGDLDLDAPIGTYLPGFRPRQAHGHPTSRQLLTHTAGLGNPIPIRWVRPAHAPTDPAAMRRVLDRHGTPRRPVGGPAAYSNIGYLQAARVIEAVTGQSFPDVVQRLVLEPMRMTRTGFRYRSDAPASTGYVRLPAAFVPALRLLLPAGTVGARATGHTSLKPFVANGNGYAGLIGTASDAARFAAVHVATDVDDHPLLSHDDIERMRTITALGKPFDHGIGWFRQPADRDRVPRFVEHYGTGGGFWNAMRIYPDDRLAIVAMTNSTARWDVDRLFGRLRDLARQ